MTESDVTPFHLLLVEDSEADIRLAREALSEYRVVHHLHAVSNGEDAIAFLRRTGRFADAPRPSLILLDLNLPRKDGREVLTEVKADDDLKNIPVVVLTSSRAEADVARSYALHANCYIVKPVTFDTFVEIMRRIGDFWFTVVRLPDRAAEERGVPQGSALEDALVPRGRHGP
jgi:CheY-like chemotaxis protein